MGWFSKCKHEWDEVACAYSDSIKDYTFKENAWINYSINDMLEALAIIQNGQTTIEYQCLICGDHYMSKTIGKRTNEFS